MSPLTRHVAWLKYLHRQLSTQVLSLLAPLSPQLQGRAEPFANTGSTRAFINFYFLIIAISVPSLRIEEEGNKSSSAPKPLFPSCHRLHLGERFVPSFPTPCRLGLFVCEVVPTFMRRTLLNHHRLWLLSAAQ